MHLGRLAFSFQSHQENRESRVFSLSAVANIGKLIANHHQDISDIFTQYKMQTYPNAKPLIITGMHRSGTSLATSLLQSAGLNIGTHLLEAGPGNPKGHFENLDFYDFHRAVLGSIGLQPSGWTLESSINVPDNYREEAQQILQRNVSEEAWGWKSPRSTLFSEFWLEYLPNANFLFLFRPPWQVIESLYRRGSDGIFLSNPELAIAYWLSYNRKLLKLLAQRPNHCMLVSLDTVVDYPHEWVDTVNQRFGYQLTLPDMSIYDVGLLKREVEISYRTTLFKIYFQEALDLLSVLENAAWTPQAKDAGKGFDASAYLSDKIFNINLEEYKNSITADPERLGFLKDWTNSFYYQREFKRYENIFREQDQSRTKQEQLIQSLTNQLHTLSEENSYLKGEVNAFTESKVWFLYKSWRRFKEKLKKN